MANQIDFTFSDTITGYVTHFNRADRSFTLSTSDGRVYTLNLKPNTFARMSMNLGEGYIDATGRISQLLTPGQLLFAYCLFYPLGDNDFRIEVQSIIFPGEGPGIFRHEEADWWTKQVFQIAKSYMKWQFGYPESGTIDYKDYRTFLHLAGVKKGDFLQETDTISRLVYGFASAFLMTGEDSYLEAAEAGTEYLREHMRFVDTDNNVIYWFHGIKIQGDMEVKLLTSEFSDDYDCIPAYEQIYALAGPIQTYRATGDQRIYKDAEDTVRLFEQYYKDNERGGYFSHLDPYTLDPRAESLGRNRGTKNWNSVGDHAPAYLINLWLATGEERYAKMLEYCFDCIRDHFQDYANSPFVQEKFHEDWSADQTWGWQQNGAVVGHNLKIAWNLTRMFGLMPKEDYKSFAQHIGQLMPKVGSDNQRGGWYDVVQRVPDQHTGIHHHVFHDRKAWWQQEQAILAYLIMEGVYGDEESKRLGREAAAFYNAHFLDHDDGGVYFNVLASGVPYLLGNERFKGSHSMSGYHSTELCYLSAIYQNLLILKNPMDFYFKPHADGFADGILRVAPDILPPGRVRIDSVEIDGVPYAEFDASALTVTLPKNRTERVKIKVRIAPN